MLNSSFANCSGVFVEWEGHATFQIDALDIRPPYYHTQQHPIYEVL
jgi:hypothetical protein